MQSLTGTSKKPEDPENLPEDFIQRLSQARLRSPSPPTQPAVYEEELYPEDDYHQLWETSSALTQPLDKEKQYRDSLQRETEAYHALINNRGRPSHLISLLKDIVKNPGEYRKILSF
ncbi:hypothetical protein K469DRAFT_697612 [Zopfia rhizophila CBS 207.26]|uniref:Uncharacterized protein n=1 Tax=Zopfia rhizophila CBS 207.26 TaxID=1314779 RepID=A0A6A6DEJ8_9PEZI|nr:hypothetical protein K469DRAFT_697612 [Zopfia rhizophila CBS 207.26]